MYSVADLDLELRTRGGGGGGGLLAWPAFLPSAFFSFFTQNRGAGSVDPSPRSAAIITCHWSVKIVL